MKEKIFALTSVLTLLLTTGMAAAFWGPDGTIDTYFDASGAMPVFESFLVLEDGDYVNEKVWTLGGLVVVTENIELDDHRFGPTDANIDKDIFVDPGSLFCFEFDAHVEKTAVWGGVGEVYRRADLEDGTISIVDASTLYGNSMFIDNIEYNDYVHVYESVGLNTYASCDPVETPDPLPMPVCGWC